MKKILTYIVFATMLFGLFNCEPKFEIENYSIEKKLVVDGWIENGQYPMVILTYNTPYFSNLDSSSFLSLIEAGVKVLVSDGQQTEILTLTRDTNYFPSLLYRGNEIKGEIGKNYYLFVFTKSDTISAKTTIPTQANVKNIRLVAVTDTSGEVKGEIVDDPDKENFYRTFTKIEGKNKRFIPNLVSAYSDKYFNGQNFTFSLKRGMESYLGLIENIYYPLDKTILLKVSSIDKDSYNFWSDYEQEILNSSNPFASNIKSIQSNIRGGLGIWCGYSSTIYQVKPLR